MNGQEHPTNFICGVKEHNLVNRVISLEQNMTSQSVKSLNIAKTLDTIEVKMDRMIDSIYQLTSLNEKVSDMRLDINRLNEEVNVLKDAPDVKLRERWDLLVALALGSIVSYVFTKFFGG